MKSVRASDLPTGHMEAHRKSWRAKVDIGFERQESRFERALERLAREKALDAGRREDFEKLERALIRLRAYDRCCVEYEMAQRWPEVAAVVAKTGYEFGSAGDGTARSGVPMLPGSVESPYWAEDLCSRADEAQRANEDERDLRRLRRVIERSGGEVSRRVADAYADTVLRGVAIGEERRRDARSWANGAEEREWADRVRRFDEVWCFGKLERALDAARDSRRALFQEERPATKRGRVGAGDR